MFLNWINSDNGDNNPNSENPFQYARKRKKSTDIPSESIPDPQPFSFGSSLQAELRKVMKISSITKLKVASDYSMWRRQIMTYLKLHNLDKYILRRMTGEAENSVVLTILMQTVDSKLCYLINNCVVAFEAFNILTSYVRGSSRQQLLDAYHKLHHIQYESLGDYIRKFQSNLSSLQQLTSSFSNDMILVAFESGIPRIGKSYVQALMQDRQDWKLDTFIIQLQNLVPQHIWTKSTRPNRNNTKPNSTKYTKFQNKRKQFGRQHTSGAPKRSNNVNVVENPSPHVHDEHMWVSGGIAQAPGSPTYNASSNMVYVPDTDTQIKARWILDSGSSLHICGDVNLLHEVKKLTQPKQLGSFTNTTYVATHVGKLSLRFTGRKFIIPEVYIINGSNNLLSTNKLLQQGFSFNIIADVGVLIYYEKNLVYRAQVERDGLCYYDPSRVNFKKSLPIHDEILWHYRLGHPSSAISKLCSQEQVKCTAQGFCNPCCQGKFSRKPIPSKALHRRTLATLPFYRLHADTIGPIKPKSFGCSYALLLTDEYTQYRWLSGFSKKQDIGDYIIKLIKRVQNTMQYRLCFFHCDNGTELLPARVLQFFQDTGVALEPSFPYTPEQNGVSERSNRTTEDKARTMLMAAMLPLTYWLFALMYAVVLLNRLPSLKTCKAPYELFYKREPFIKHLRVFGCKVMALIPCNTQTRKKFTDRAVPGIFIGLSEVGRSYQVWVPKWKCVKSFRTVKFNEQELIRKAIESPHHRFHLQYEDLFRPPLTDRVQVNMVRQIKRLSSLDRHTVPRSYSQILSFTPEVKAGWLAAYNKEIQALTTVGDLKIIPIQEATGPIIPLTELFSIKYDNITQKITYKVRICVRGDKIQEPDSTFAPVLADETLKLTLLLYGTDVTLEGFQSDISTAFLHARDYELHFYALPKALRRPGMCWAGFCAIYGRPKSPRDWNRHFDVYIKDFGFRNAITDVCLYLFFQQNKLVGLLKLYVDDLRCYFTTLDMKRRFKAHLLAKFQIKYTENVKEFIGIEFETKGSQIKLHCKKKILELANVFEIDAHPTSTPTPMRSSADIFDTSSAFFKPVRLYQSLIGSLNWIGSHCRPDILTAINKLGMFQANPRVAHFRMAKRVLSYLVQTQNYGIKLEKITAPIQITAYVDSNLERKNDGLSTYGFVIFINGYLLKAKSKRFVRPTTVTCLAETWALLEVIPEINHTLKLLEELKQDVKSVKVFCDNKAAVDVFSTLKGCKTVKELDLREATVRYKFVTSKIHHIEYIKSADNLADFFTKIVKDDLFYKFRQMLVQI